MQFKKAANHYSKEKDNVVRKEAVEDKPVLSCTYEQVERELQVAQLQVDFESLKNALEVDFAYMDKNGVMAQLSYISKAKQDAYKIYVVACRERERYRFESNKKLWHWGKEFEEATSMSPSKNWSAYQEKFTQWLCAEKGTEYWEIENKTIRLKEYRGLFEELWKNLTAREFNLRERVRSFE